MKTDRNQRESHAKKYREYRTPWFPVFCCAMGADQPPDAVEQRFDKERKHQAYQQRGKQIGTAEVVHRGPKALPEEFRGRCADSYPQGGRQR